MSKHIIPLKREIMKTIKEEVGENIYNSWPIGARMAIEQLESSEGYNIDGIPISKKVFVAIEELNEVHRNKLKKAKAEINKNELDTLRNTEKLS
jgi:hypothetical protein